MTALIFLIETVIGFFTILFLLRLYMQVLRVSFLGPLGQFVITLTNWAVRPLRRIIPPWGGFDLASLLPAILLQLGLAILSHVLLPRHLFADDTAMALFFGTSALLGIVRESIRLFIGALIVQAVLSWVNPRSPIAAPIHQFTRPFLDPIRRILPPISGIDLSPLVAIVLAQAILYLL